MRLSFCPDPNNLGIFQQIDLSFEELASVIATETWAPAIFKENIRRKKNFLESSIIALDVDEGLTLKDTVKEFASFRHIIATTRSHGIPKGKRPACDRFRVILFLENPVTSVESYEATARSLIETFKSDEACKDASRMFYPSPGVISKSFDGTLLKVVEAQPKEDRPKLSPLSTTQKGRLSRHTLEFLVRPPEEGWNAACFKAAKDWQEQGYTEEEFVARIEAIDGYIDEPSLKTVKSAFSKEPKHPPRIDPTNQEANATILEGLNSKPLSVSSEDMASELFSYLDNKELVKGELTGLEGLDRLLAGKRLGEVTALCAEGKTGKNALWHYLQWLWLKRGIRFAYASRELDPITEVLPDYLSMELESNVRLDALTDDKKLLYVDLLKQWKIPFAPGYGHFPLSDLERWVVENKEQGINYFFFDHLHWMCEDPEDYKEASLLSRRLKEIAKTHSVHIDVIIQPKVLMDGQRPSLNSMKGGSALGQNIDNLLTLERVPGERFISRLSLKAKRSRLAETGEILIRYDKESLKFTEVEEELNQDSPSSQPTLRLASRSLLGGSED